MAITRTETQVLWAAAVTKSVAAAGAETSDAFTFPVDQGGISISIKADNAGTPAAGSTLDVYVLLTNGDPDADADSADEYDSTGHGRFLCQIDTNTDDPAHITVELSTAAQGGKLYVENNDATNAVTVSAQMSIMDLE